MSVKESDFWIRARARATEVARWPRWKRGERSLHVIALEGGGWIVIDTGERSPVGRYGSETEAIRFATDLIEKMHGEMFVHDRGGEIRERVMVVCVTCTVPDPAGVEVNPIAEPGGEQATGPAGRIAMGGSKNIHVTRREDGWAVVREGADRASSLHPTQSGALDVGRDMARRERGELFIHDRDNRIRDRDSFGNDPFPPRDHKH